MESALFWHSLFHRMTREAAFSTASTSKWTTEAYYQNEVECGLEHLWFPALLPPPPSKSNVIIKASFIIIMPTIFTCLYLSSVLTQILTSGIPFQAIWPSKTASTYLYKFIVFWGFFFKTDIDCIPHGTVASVRFFFSFNCHVHFTF